MIKAEPTVQVTAARGARNYVCHRRGGIGAPESAVKVLKGSDREFYRLLGRKALDNEALKESIEVAREPHVSRSIRGGQ